MPDDDLLDELDRSTDWTLPTGDPIRGLVCGIALALCSWAAMLLVYMVLA